MSIKGQTSLGDPGLISGSIETQATVGVTDLMHGIDQKGGWPLRA